MVRYRRVCALDCADPCPTTEDFRADEWMLFETHSPCTSNGRGVAFGNIFDSSGKLVVSVAQEAFIEYDNLEELRVKSNL